MTPPVRLSMSVSLDGFIAGPDDRPGRELGEGGGRLFNWLDDRMSPGINGKVYAELMATGAVISGRRTFELAGRWSGDHHDGVPIFVLTHQVPEEPPPGSACSATPPARCTCHSRCRLRTAGTPSPSTTPGAMQRDSDSTTSTPGPERCRSPNKASTSQPTPAAPSGTCSTTFCRQAEPCLRPVAGRRSPALGRPA
jgi:hypothetical protein